MAVVMLIEKHMLKGIFKKNVEEEALLIEIQSPFLRSGPWVPFPCPPFMECMQSLDFLRSELSIELVMWRRGRW